MFELTGNHGFEIGNPQQYRLDQQYGGGIGTLVSNIAFFGNFHPHAPGNARMQCRKGKWIFHQNHDQLIWRHADVNPESLQRDQKGLLTVQQRGKNHLEDNPAMGWSTGLVGMFISTGNDWSDTVFADRYNRDDLAHGEVIGIDGLDELFNPDGVPHKIMNSKQIYIHPKRHLQWFKTQFDWYQTTVSGETIGILVDLASGRQYHQPNQNDPPRYTRTTVEYVPVVRTEVLHS